MHGLYGHSILRFHAEISREVVIPGRWLPVLLYLRLQSAATKETCLLASREALIEPLFEVPRYEVLHCSVNVMLPLDPRPYPRAVSWRSLN